jgi:hypothetical protein
MTIQKIFVKILVEKKTTTQEKRKFSPISHLHTNMFVEFKRQLIIQII